MVTKPEHTKSSEIGTGNFTIKELQDNPIFVPISDYLKGSAIFEKEDERETNNLSKSKDRLNKSLDTGIYDNSKIVIIYKEVISLWERIAWIYQKNVSLANKQIALMKNATDKFYITKMEFKKQIDDLEEELKLEKSKKEVTDKQINDTIPESIEEENKQTQEESEILARKLDAD